MIDCRPRKVPGRWRDGYALDIHTTSSIPLGYDEFGHMQFETTRSALGEALYRLKNRVETAADFVRSWRPGIDMIVPVPASTKRKLQPVLAIAEGLGLALALPVVDCVKATRETRPLKNVFDFDERMKLLAGLFEVDASVTEGRRILLFDDLYRSGATMNAISEVLYDRGRASEVFGLTITQTRVHR
jgi:competence protein ComFC